MRYVGGKFRIAKQLTDFLKSVRKSNQTYVEPFVGGASVIRLMDDLRIGSDICPFLITFYQQLQLGYIPPETISEERYKELKELSKRGVCNAEIGFCGYFTSFAGKWFGGVARDPRNGYDFVRGARNSCLKFKPYLQQIKFYCSDYQELFKIIPINSLIYCDIPYINTTGYRFKFDHESYWKFIREQSNSHDIYTSSYVAPEDFECVWQIERKTCMNTIGGGKSDRIEKLFKFKGK